MLDRGFQWLTDNEPVISAFVGLVTLMAASWSIIQFFVYHRKASAHLAAGATADNAVTVAAPASVWSTLLNLGLTQRSQIEELVSVRTVNIAVLGILLISFAYIVASLFSGENVYLTIVHGVTFLSALIILVLQGSGKTRLARWVFFILAALYWVTIMVGVGPFYGVEFYLALLLTLPILLFGRRESKDMLLAVALMSLAFAAGVFLQSRLPPFLAADDLAAIPYHLNVILIGLTMFMVVNFYNSFAARSFHDLEQQKRRTDELINSMLPEYIASRIGNDHATVADWHSEATVLVGTIVGFETLCQRISAVQFVELLSQLFIKFDKLVKKHGIDKVNTLDTTYVVASGIGREAAPDHCAVASFALEALEVVREFSMSVSHPFVFRAGISTGQVVSGVIGEARPCFDIWGETVELANSMRNTAIDNSIVVNEPAYWRLRNRFDFAVSGAPESTYLLLRARDSQP